MEPNLGWDLGRLNGIIYILQTNVLTERHLSNNISIYTIVLSFWFEIQRKLKTLKPPKAKFWIEDHPISLLSDPLASLSVIRSLTKPPSRPPQSQSDSYHCSHRTSNLQKPPLPKMPSSYGFLIPILSASSFMIDRHYQFPFSAKWIPIRLKSEPYLIPLTYTKSTRHISKNPHDGLHQSPWMSASSILVCKRLIRFMCILHAFSKVLLSRSRHSSVGTCVGSRYSDCRLYFTPHLTCSAWRLALAYTVGSRISKEHVASR